jgi:Flp pilus assembly pilin Flp
MPSANEPQYRPTHAAIPAESIGSSSNSVASEVLVSNSFSRCRALLRRTRRSVERGATAVEYALMVGLIAVGIVTAVSSLRDKTTDSLNQTAASTRGLIFLPRVKAGEQFTVKYIRNDTGIGGWTSVGATGASHGQTGVAGAVGSQWDNLIRNGVEWTATLTAPSTPGVMEVQVRTSGVGGTILETGVLRVTP